MAKIEAKAKHVILPDGRMLAYAGYGQADGIPVIHCNGSGGSRLEWPGDEAMLKELGVRFISIDRPGHGQSDPFPGRSLLDWPNDLTHLVDHLGIERFYIEGWSVGGAYALATAYALKDRVTAGAILSSIGPFDRSDPYDGLDEQIREWMKNARENPDAVFAFRRSMAQALSDLSETQIGRMLAGGQRDDGKLAAQRPDLQNLMGLNIKEGYRLGPDGPARDDIIINSPWGFRLEDVEARIDIWQGEIDVNVPLIQGAHQHSVLPDSTLRVLENTAHLFPLVRWKEILVQLLRT